MRYSIRRNVDGAFFCAEKSYDANGHFNGMWITGDTFWQLLAPGHYEIVEI